MRSPASRAARGAFATGGPVPGEDAGEAGRAEGASGERELIAAALLDPAAFAGLYRQYILPIFRYLYGAVGDPHEAEDLAAATFSKALAGPAGYGGRGSFAAWLFGIARHTLRDYQRAHYGRPRPVALGTLAYQLPDLTPSPEAQVLQAEQLGRLHHLVRQLPADQQEALVLRVFGELSTRETAAVLGRSEGAVKMLVHRAVTTLRGQYGSAAQEEPR